MASRISSKNTTRNRRGRLSVDDWKSHARYILRHLNDPISLQRSPLCRLAVMEQLARAKYPNGVVARGRALHDLAHECIQEIEDELDGHAGVAKLQHFVALARDGKGVTEASRAIGVSPEYACRALKRSLVELLAEKMQMKLH